jgi:hypothetical protein
MIQPKPDHIIHVGILDYKKFDEQLLPLMERAQGSEPQPAIDDAKMFVANIKDRETREHAMTQLERVETATHSGRWHEAASGLVLEASCVEETRQVVDLLDSTRIWVDFLYDWDEDAAKTINTFFAFLTDYSLEWASPGDIWRAAVPPDVIAATADAMNGLTPRQFRKHLLSVEEADVFEEEEAELLSEWWGELRSAMRMAKRLEYGLLIAIEEDD